MNNLNTTQMKMKQMHLSLSADVVCSSVSQPVSM